MESIQFKATVDGFKGDKLGGAKITFEVPYSDRSAAGKASELVNQILIITVTREADVNGICEQREAKRGKRK